MACKLSSLFSIGDDFDDEDLLGTDWAVRSESGPADVAAADSSCTLRSASVSLREPGERKGPQQTGEGSSSSSSSAALRSSTASWSITHAAAGQTVAQGLRQLSSSSSANQPQSLRPSSINNSASDLTTRNSPADVDWPLKPKGAQDDFDDWDVDLADLDGFDGLTEQPPQPSAQAVRAPSVDPASSARTLRPPACGRIHTQSNVSLRELNTSHQSPLSSNHNPGPQSPSTPRFPPPKPRTPSMSVPQRTPGVIPGLARTTPVPSPVSRTLIRPHQPQRQWATPGSSPQARGLFETVAAAHSPSNSSSALPLHPHHTPVLTNRLVQLVSASSKLPKKRPRSDPHRPRTRRFPGPAGLLPQQPQGPSMDEIVVSVPVIPAHGAAARLPSQGSSSQTEEDDFSGGAWAAMKAETGLDERNPSCFLHSYSVVMVLRKAVLKQLARNKVPNMAVLLKSIIHTHADAKAVFKDPTGEIQGTVHRRLLEDRIEELKVGAVLLLKQVGVFSPSHRNHYLNVTPNNLLRIYAPDGVCPPSTHLPPIVLEPTFPSPARSRSVSREPVSRMHLMFDEEDDEAVEGSAGNRASVDTAGSTRGPQEAAGKSAAQDSGWDADDDLDDLLGELPEDTYSL